jgi:hypothetical protein
LTVKSNLTLVSGSTVLIQVQHSPLTNSGVKVSGVLTYGGTLIVTNTGMSLVAGDVFPIFSATNYAGAFTTTNLPPLGNYLYWTNELAMNGSLAVVSSISTTPPNLSLSVTGTNLVLFWPADHAGWWLQVQTNSLNTGLGTNWYDVAGSTLTNSAVMPLNTGNNNVFYRLVYP